LISTGVKPGEPVGVCLYRKPMMVAVLMAILKAGAAYLPLDPHFPKDRLNLMLEDSGANILITESKLAGDFKEINQIEPLDSLTSKAASFSTDLPELDIQPESLAYLIYTSGSTGKPKGVAIEHGSVVNFLNSMSIEPGFEENDRVLALTTISFDISVLEIFLPLITGGSLVLIGKDDGVNGRRIAEILENQKITVMQATPVTWKLLLESNWKGKSDLKMLCGGEAMSGELAKDLLPLGKELWNVYGPTEATVWASLCKVNDLDEETRCWQNSVTIGSPIHNTAMYILEPTGSLAPIGVPGELLIAGDCLARGYHDREQLTAERFIEQTIEGKTLRLYRTGDLARWRTDGMIDFLGRIDNQVKIRGYRIELGEIEAVIRAHEFVSDSVVIIREDTPGDKRLIAYYIPEKDASLQRGELRKRCSSALPDYMIPSAFVELDEFPLTPNKKIDRNSLPKPSADRESAGELIHPRTPTEKKLLKIWKGVLHLEEIGIKQNFFVLGGHSLNLITILARIEQQFGQELHMRVFFQHPTIERLGRILMVKLLSKTVIRSYQFR
jgi:amino acid adenylation domain-containing protein